MQDLDVDSCVHSLEKMLTVSVKITANCCYDHGCTKAEQGFRFPTQTNHQNLLNSLTQVPLVDLHHCYTQNVII